MKTWTILTVLAALLLASLPAMAGDTDHPWSVLIVDKDTHGTNIRDAPGGTIVEVIPFTSAKEKRPATIYRSSAGWLETEYKGTTGWIHHNVLGICATGTEDGDPVLSQSPTNDSTAVTRIPAGAPLIVLDMFDAWLQVQYLDSKGDIVVGWIPEQAVSMSENEMNDCVKAWARQ